MGHAFGIVGLAVAAFVSTNLDDLLLLASLFVDAGFSPRSIIVGQLVGMAVLVAASAAAALAAVMVPAGWLALLGFAPLLLGLHRFWKLWRDQLPKPGEREFFGPEQLRWQSHPSAVWATMMLTIANGGDNVSVYIPLFATQRAFIGVYLLIFACLTGVWCLLGYYLTHHPVFRQRLKKYGRILVPFILVGIGLKVLGRLA
jgi:cadmium resistance protein CadD (predicted permease)